MLLSVLDLSFVRSGVPASRALHDTVALARAVDDLGYHRFWVAEHHSLPSVASPAPEIMIGQIAAATRRLRVGSGGVMLPNHAPLAVAERFRMLEGLFPGRIDLGLGRAPGTDGVTAFALRRLQEQHGGDDFLERLQELIAWDTGGFEPGHPFTRVTVMPDDVRLPPLWLLGSSDYSAQLSGRMGLGFAFASHFASHDAGDAMLSYRRLFRPSQWRQAPHAILGVAAICAETDAEAERLALSADLSTLRRNRGHYGPVPTIAEAQAEITEGDRPAIQRQRARLHVGSPERLRETLTALARATQADEIMITAAIHDQGAKARSYALLAEAFGSAARQAAE